LKSDFPNTDITKFFTAAISVPLVQYIQNFANETTVRLPCYAYNFESIG